MKRATLAVPAIAAAAGLTACGTAAPTVAHTVIVTVTPKTTTASNTPPSPSSSPSVSSSAAAPAPAAQPSAAAPPAQPEANATSVVLQFYQDITNGDYSAAWALGGDNLSGGVSYGTWVSGYQDTTASIDVISYGSFSSGEVWADISAVQLDGSTKTYSGTYTVQNGEITAADIRQTS